MISLLSPCVDKLNQRNTLWRTVVQTSSARYQSVCVCVCGPRVRFPCCTRSQSLADFQWKQQKYKKGRQTKLFFFYFSSVCLVYLFCWKQPTTISALLKTLKTHTAHSPVHLGIQWDHVVPPLTSFSFSFQWASEVTVLILSASSKKYLKFLTRWRYTSNEFWLSLNEFLFPAPPKDSRVELLATIWWNFDTVVEGQKI